MKVKLTKTDFEGLLVLEVDYYPDKRGFFGETYNRRDFKKAGINDEFVQDSHSRSVYKTLRGLHLQDAKAPLAKLVRCARGRIFDVAVDLRSKSKTFGKWFAIELDDENKKQLYIPVGFAHGFEVLSDVADVEYKQTRYWVSESEITIVWNDRKLAINWPISDPMLSKRDAKGISLADYLKNPAF